jgi:transcriptional regulator with XRE-family HTH domain
MLAKAYMHDDCMANDICVRFGRRLQQIRLKKGLKQIELSEHTGIARTYLSLVENGKTEICLRRIEELAMALDMKPWELMKGV